MPAESVVLSKERLDRYEYDAIDLTPFPLDSCVAGYVRPLPLGEAGGHPVVACVQMPEDVWVPA